MKIVLAVYHDLNTEERSDEIFETSKMIGETYLVSLSKPPNPGNAIIYQTTTRNYLKFIKLAKRVINEVQPDVVILHDNYGGILIPYCQRVKSKPFVVYDLSELDINTKESPAFNKKEIILNFIEKKYITHSNFIISASAERSEIMMDYFGLKELPDVYDNMHRIEDDVDIVLNDAKFGMYFNKDGFNILFGGGLFRDRYVFNIIDAVKKLGSRYSLNIVGAYAQKDLDYFNSLDKPQSIRYHGFVSRSEFRYFITKSNVSVITFNNKILGSKYCASGKMYESIFEGVPILASENPPLKRICDGHGVGVANNDFEKGIITLENNYKQYVKSVKEYCKTLDYDGRKKDLANRILNKYKQFLITKY